jgi:SAM-dependent methyltransferase
MPRLTANLAIDRYDYAADALGRLKTQLPSLTVFDIGPGDGRMRRIEADGFAWRGFDRTGWDDVTTWDLTDPWPAGEAKAGAALLLDVIEHTANPGLGLQHVADALAPGGYLVLTVPNPGWSASRINLLVKGFVSGFSPRDLDENHHVFTPWPHILERLLNDAGFSVVEYVTLNGHTTPFRAEGGLFLPARYALNLVLMLIERLAPASRGMSYGVVARRSDAAPSDPR